MMVEANDATKTPHRVLTLDVYGTGVYYNRKGHQRIQGALRGLEGVHHSHVDLARSWVTITFDPHRVSVWNIFVAIEQTGYDVGALVPAASQHLMTEPPDKRRAATPAPAASEQRLSAS